MGGLGLHTTCRCYAQTSQKTSSSLSPSKAGFLPSKSTMSLSEGQTESAPDHFRGPGEAEVISGLSSGLQVQENKIKV